ncbi:MAG: hypothetical protein LH614_00700 [Pyrinomonadaceae bacterium]|nr:hypothetical protein [Pyrinomonadaceae bacterium]
MEIQKSNQCLISLGLYGILFLIISVSQIFAQTDIETSKKLLEKLNQQLIEIDADQRNELNALQKRSSVKGEFETTKKFDERSKKEETEWNSLYNQIDSQQGIDREKIYKEINRILSKEFSGVFQVDLGVYDADKQVFPLLINKTFKEFIVVPLGEARELKENFSKAEKTGILGVVLDSKNQAIEYLISGQIKYNGKVYNITTNTFSNSRAMRMLFGNYDDTSKYATWTLYLQKFYVDGSDEDVYVPVTVYAKILAIKSYTDQNQEKRVLITQTAPTLEDNSCHACSVTISVAVFSKQNDYWKIEQAQKNTGRYGSFGEVSPPIIVKIGINRYALKYDSFYMNMGEAAGGEQYITLDGGLFNEIFNVSTHQDNTASMASIKDQMSSNSKVIFKPFSDSVYFDAIVSTSGKRGKKIGNRYMLSPFVQTDLYRCSDGKYLLVKK